MNEPEKPDTLMGFPIVYVDDMPGIKAEEIVLGDVSQIKYESGMTIENPEIAAAFLEAFKLKQPIIGTLTVRLPDSFNDAETIDTVLTLRGVSNEQRD